LLAQDRVGRLAFAEELESSWRGGVEKRLQIFRKLNTWLSWGRDLALVNSGLGESHYVTNYDYLRELQRQVRQLNALQIKEMLQAFTRVQAELEANVSPRLALGDLFLNKLPRLNP
jgi:hypothetical protein